LGWNGGGGGCCEGGCGGTATFLLEFGEGGFGGIVYGIIGVILEVGVLGVEGCVMQIKHCIHFVFDESLGIDIPQLVHTLLLYGNAAELD
jgi:hypothetical protein